MNKTTEPNPQVELAVQRTELAVERTQLAWVRTAFALISAGLAVAKGTEALHEAKMLAGKRWVDSGYIGGIVLMMAAVIFLAIATYSYCTQIRDIARHHGQRPPWLPQAVPISIFIMAIGIALSTLLLMWG